MRGDRRSGSEALIFRLVSWKQPGQLYRALRKAKGLKGHHIAAELGISQPAVSQVETGKRRLPPSDNPGPEGRSWASRELWDEVLALGDAAGGETRPTYTVGLLAEDHALPRMSEPLVVVRDRDAADAVAAKLAETGVARVVVVPMWSSWVKEHGGALLDDADGLWRAVRLSES